MPPTISAPLSHDECTMGTQLRQELRDCAIKLRKLAYNLPHGVGEFELLRLSEHMAATADQPVLQH